jgi:hypothetical protein
LDSYKYYRRAGRPGLSHRGVDRQPNDHLGRSCFWPHLFEYRRQILRGCINSDTHAYPDSNIHHDRHSDSNNHTDDYSNTDGDGKT